MSCYDYYVRLGKYFMEFSQIRYFLAVAEHLNFTNAADACAVSQPALSKAISKLEETLGGELFDRSSHQVMLTEFGRVMRVQFELIEDSRRMALQAAKKAASVPTRKLNIGVMCTVSSGRFAQFIKIYQAANPSLEIVLHDVTGMAIPEKLLNGELDCVFCARSQTHDQRFDAIKLFEEPMLIAFANGHRFGDMTSVPLAEIAKEPYLDRLYCEFREDFLTRTKASGLKLNVVLSSNREDWILELVKNGMGVSLIPESSKMPGFIKCRPVTEFANPRNLELVMTEQSTTMSPLSEIRQFATSYHWS